MVAMPGVRKITLLVVLLAFGCGSSNSNNNSEGDVARRCNEVGDSLCQTNADCAVETASITQAERGEFVANSVSGYKQSLDCSRVTRTTGSPDVCEADLAATPCAQYDATTGLPVPASCRSIFQR